MDRSFRHRVATGSFTLPVALVVTVVLWVLPAPSDPMVWTGLLATAVTAYVMVEWNNRYALLRIRSRLTTAAYLLLNAACFFLHAWDLGMAAAACMLVAYLILFGSYQERRAEGYVFYAFLFTGLGSLCYPPLLFLLPVHFFAMLVQLRSLTLRSFFAGLLGVFVPYWCYGAYAAWNNRLDLAFDFLAPYFRFSLPDYTQWLPTQAFTLGFLALLTLPAIVHFWRTAFNDKIKTRLLLHIIVIQEVVLWLLLVFRQDDWATLLRLLLVNSVPLIAHYFALARGRMANVWFVVSLLLLFFLAAFNLLSLWMPSINSW